MVNPLANFTSDSDFYLEPDQKVPVTVQDLNADLLGQVAELSPAEQEKLGLAYSCSFDPAVK